MKLIFCTECHDIVKLTLETRSCKCGLCSGKYLNDVVAEYSGPAVPLGIDNSSFAEALRTQPRWGMGRVFTGFVIPKVCNTFKKLD